jgi:hypothetical protein
MKGLLPLFLLSLFSIMHLRISVFLFFIQQFCHSQVQIGIPIDTLRSSYSSLGKLDTMDFNGIYFSSSFPLRSIHNRFGFPSIDLLDMNSSIYSSIQNKKAALTFSALPHVGFSYLFGSQGSQLLGLNYQQAFKKEFLLNAQIGTDKTDGFFRNTAFSKSSYAFQLARKSKQHSFLLVVFRGKELREWNGGVISDSQAVNFSPDLLPVKKNNASSLFINSKICLTNSVSLFSDSSRVFGIEIKQYYENIKRTYLENYSIVNSYDSIYFNSLQTNDFYTLKTFENQLGIFYKTPSLEFSTHAVLRNWNYANFDIKSDTTEFDINEQFQFKNKFFQLSNSSSLNLYGAKNTFRSFSEVNSIFSGYKIAVNHTFIRSLPLVFQRYYSSNNVFYKLENFELQTHQKLKFAISKSLGKKFFSLDYSLISFKQNYFFNTSHSKWQRDLAISSAIIQQAKISSELHFSIFHIYPSYTFTRMDKSINFLPQHTFETRFLIKGGIFKAKKLKGMLGFDFIVLSSYKSLTFNPQMGIFDFKLLSQTAFNSGTMNAGVFSGFEVDKFRFFLRWDNLAYLWANRMQTFIIGSPMPSTQIKIGLTWDFWN